MKVSTQTSTCSEKLSSLRIATAHFSFILMTILLGAGVSFAQTSVQDFGNSAASHTSQTASTSFLPAPTPSGGGTTYARAGATAPNAPIVLATASNPLGTTGAFVRGVASTSTSVSKFSPAVNYTAGKQFYTSFKALFGNSSAGSGSLTGNWSFYQGNGLMYSDNNNFTNASICVGLQFTYGASGALSLSYRGGGSLITTGLTSTALSQAVVYNIEIIGNNNSSGTINYSYNGNPQSVGTQKFDLYINGTLFGDDLATNTLPANTDVLSTTFIGVSSTSNAANIFVDDVVVYNSIPSSIGTAPSVPEITSSLTAGGSVGASFNYNITATNTPTSYSATDLPPGLTVNTSTGLISGTPTTAGVYNTLISATNGGGTSDVETLVITVSQGSQTISFGTLSAKTFGDDPFALTASASSGLTVSYSSSNTSVATVSGSTVTIVGAGSTTITASQSGDANWTAATPVDQTLTVNKATQTITFGPLADKLDTDSPFTLSATASSGLTVSYSSSNTAVATVSGNTVTITGPGTTIITASQSGNDNYEAATPVDQEQEVTNTALSNQTITFGPLSNKIYGDAPFTLNATASSGLTVTYTSSNTSVATVSGNTVTIVAPGTTTITASQAGNSSYNPADDVDQTLTVEIKDLTVSGATADSKVYDGTDAATISGGTLNGIVGSDDVSFTGGGTFADPNVGTGIAVTASLSLTGADAAKYSITQPAGLTADISQASQTISFGALAAKTFGDSPFALTATASSGLDVTYSSSNTAVATISGNTVTIVGAGSTTITASQSGDMNYSAALPVDQELVVAKANQSITFAALASKVYGDAPFELTGTSSSGLTVSYTSSNTLVATVSGSTVTITGIGSTTITASQAGDDNYNSATDVNRTLTVTAPTLAIWNPSWSGTAPSPLDATTKSSDVESATVTRVGLGSGSSSTRYSSNNWTASNYLAVTLTAATGKAMDLNDQTVSISMGSSGTGPSQYFLYSSVDNYTNSLGTLTPTCSGAAGANSVVLPSSGYNGLTTITFRVYGNQTGCSSTFGTGGTGGFGVLSIAGTTSSLAAPVITSSLAENGTVGVAFSYSITATNSPSIFNATGLPAGLSVNTSTGAITGTPAEAGTFNVTISASNGTEATETLVLTIAQGSQTITFSPFGTVTYGDAPITLNATASSGLTVSYSSSNTAVATISGDVLTIVGAGTATITASQAGDVNYAAAVPVEEILTVGKADQTITFGPLDNKNDTDGPYALTAIATSGLAVSYSSSNTSVATVSGNIVTIVGAGTTTITASQAGDDNYNAAASVDQDQLVINTSLSNQTITFNALDTVTYGDAPFALTATASSGLTVAYASSNTSVATVTGNTVTIIAPGTTTITASQAGNGSYNPAPDVTQDLVVTTKELTVAGAVADNKIYDGSTVATISGATLVGVVGTDDVTLSGGGTFADPNAGTGIAVTPSLIISGAQSSYYTLAQPTGLTADILPAEQTITFNAIPYKTTTDANFNLTAFASSGFDISYTSSNPAVAVIVGDTAVQIVGAGVTTITASQAGGGNYAAADDVTQSLTVFNSISSWSFEGVTFSGTSATAPSITSGSGVADLGPQTTGTLFSALHTNNSTWSTAAGNASAKAANANNWVVGDYWQFQANTAGYSNIAIMFDQTGSNTGPNEFKAQYSLDGTNFTDIGTYAITNDGWSNSGSRKAASLKYFDLSTVTDLNNTTVYFRLVSNSTNAISGTFGSGGTSRIDNFTVIGTNCSSTVTAGSYGPVCSNGSSISLAGSPAGGEWTGTGVSGNVNDGYTFNPASGTQTITYSYNNGVCLITDNTTITVNQAPVVSTGSYGPLCSNSSVITLSGTPLGGTWSGTGVSGNTFDPSAGSQLITYSYSDGTCEATEATMIMVNTAPVVTIGSFGPYTPTDPAVTLTGTPAGGTFSGTGVSGDQFDPAVAGLGLHTITYSYTDGNNCGNTATTVIEVAEGCNFTIADTIVGSKNACKYMGTLSPLNATYSIATTSASGFTWTVSNPATMSIISGQGTSSIEVHYAVTFTTGTISVEVTSACGGPATRSLAITKTAPVLGVVTGPKNACSYIGTNTEVTYSIAPIENALSYEWLMPNASTILVSGQGTTSIQVRFESGYTAGAIKVRAMSGCAYSSYKSVTVATTVPGIPSKIYGEQNACPYIDADTISYFYIRQVPNATFYNWATPQGAVIVRTGSAANGTNISPVSTLQTSDTMIGIKFDNTFVNATNLTVGSGSICGLSTGVRALALKRTVAATPGTIVGPTDACPLMVGSENPSGTPTTYTIKKVKYATSYIWTVPAGVTVLSHSGPGVNDTAITVRFESSFVIPAAIGVQSVTGCGQSAVRALNLKKLLPATPGSILGAKDPCPTIGDTTSYRVKKSRYANSYTWTVPAGGTIVDHPGGAGTANDTIIIVQWTPAFTTGAITVQAHNNCASSAVRSLTITRKLPATPGVITGPTDPCPTIGGTATYSIAALPAYATSVLWTAPSGASIVGPDNQLSVQIEYTSAFTTGVVSVVGVNACATSAPKALTISRKLPSTPGSITTTAGTCENRVYTYSILALPAYADSIIWTVPAGGTITSAGAQGLSITVSYTSEAIQGAVTARGVNKCAQGATARSLTINYPACPVGGSAPLTKVIPTVKPQEVLSMEAKVFPNPSTTSFKLQVNTTAKEQIQVRIVDVMGRAHKVLQMMPGEILNFGSELRTGTYMVEIRQGNNRTTQQIIKL